MSARVAQAWAEGVRPTYTQGDRWIIRLGANSYVTLANGPNLTAEGWRLRDLGWVEPDLSLNLFKRPNSAGSRSTCGCGLARRCSGVSGGTARGSTPREGALFTNVKLRSS